MRLRSHVLIIAASTLLPMVAIVCLVIVLLFQRERDEKLGNVVGTARALSLALDRSFQTAVGTLNALAASENLQAGELGIFYREAKRVLSTYEGAEAISLSEPQGQQILNTRVPIGTPLPRRGRIELAQRVAELRQPVISNLFVGPVAQKFIAIVSVPIIFGDAVKYVLTMSLSPSFLQKLLEQQGITKSAVTAIVDGSNIVVARSRNIDSYLGKPEARGRGATAKSSTVVEGWSEETLPGEQPSYFVHRRSEFSGWTVIIKVPRAVIDAPLWRTIWLVMSGILLCLLLLFGFAALFGRRITSSIASLATAAKALGSGASLAITPSPVFEIDEVRRELEAASVKRNEMETRLRQNEARLRAIIDAEPECVKVVAPNGKLVDMNAAGLRMLQADSLTSIADKGLLDFVLPEHRDAFSALHQKVMTGGTGKLEFEIAGLKGRKRWLETFAVPLRDASGEVKALLGATRDITERHQAEEELRYELQLVKGITDSARECIFVTDNVGNISLANPEALRTFGFTLNELSGQPLHDTLHHTYPDGRPFPREECRLSSARTDGVTIKNHEDVFFHRDGSRIAVECSNAPVEIDGQRVGAVLVVRDITERKRTLEALRASEARLKLALTAVQAGVWEWDLRTNKGFWSPECYEIVGVDHLSDSVDELMRMLNPEDVERVVASAKHAVESRSVYHEEFRVIRPGGEIRWLSNFGRAEYSEAGEPLRFIGTVRDITDRKRADEALNEQAAKLREQASLLELTHEPIMVREPDGVILFWNRGAGEMYGWSAHEAIGRNVHELLKPEFPCPLAQIERELMEKGRWDGELTKHRRDGSRVIVATRWALQRNEQGMPTAIMQIDYDITERKQAEEALRQTHGELERRVHERTAELTLSNTLLRESEELLRAILNNSPTPVFIKDPAGKYLHVNQRFTDAFGLQAQSVDGKTDAELFSAEQARMFMTNDRKVLETGQALEFEEVALYRDGAHTNILNEFPLRDREGNIYALCGIATDITERKHAEESRQQLTAELDRRVTERTRELQDSQARLRALVAELTRAEEGERRRLAVELHDYLAQTLLVCRLQVDRATNITLHPEVKQLMAETQKYLDDSINYTRTLMAELSPRVLYDFGFSPALRWLATRMEQHGLSVEIDGGDELSLEEEQAVFLFQCVRELLWNVVKHAATDKAKVAYELKRGVFTLLVEDHGKGFDPVCLNKHDNHLSQFGLFSVQSRLEIQGGDFSVSSSPGQGTRVTLSLPNVPPRRERPQATRAPEPQPTSHEAGKPIRIVLVDDHQMMRQGLRSALEGYPEIAIVGEASNGVEAVAAAQRWGPDVVLMDVNLPQMDGIEATQRILQERPSTIVIGLSFDTDDFIVRELKAAGAVDCVPKERAVEDVYRAIVDAVQAGRPRFS